MYAITLPTASVFFPLGQLLDSFDTVLAKEWFYTKSRISVCPTTFCGKYQTESMLGQNLLFAKQVQHSLIFQPRAGGSP